MATVLIVEDAAHQRKGVTNLFDSKYDLEFADNRDQAIQKIRDLRGKLAAVLLDLGIWPDEKHSFPVAPDHGFAVLETFNGADGTRRQPEYPHFVVYTIHNVDIGTYSWRERCMQAGAVFLGKTSDVGELGTALEQAVDRWKDENPVPVAPQATKDEAPLPPVSQPLLEGRVTELEKGLTDLGHKMDAIMQLLEQKLR